MKRINSMKNLVNNKRKITKILIKSCNDQFGKALHLSCKKKTENSNGKDKPLLVWSEN